MADKRPIPYARQWIFDDDIEAVIAVLRSDWLTQGAVIEQFERTLAERCGARHAVAVSSGTAALHAACFAAGIGPGDEVVTTPLSFAATANCVLYQGGTPVFADVRPDTLTMDPVAAKAACTDKTKAVIAMDYAGHPCDLGEIQALGRAHKLTIIEDAAHALGATYRGKPVGGLADMTIFSFHPVKHITTGEGGMILTNDEALSERLRLFRSHGITRDPHRYVRKDEGGWYYEVQALGFNYRITDFQCALGLTQLGKLDKFLAKRREIASAYGAVLGEIEEIELPVTLPGCESAWHLYPIRLCLERLRVGRAEIFRALRDAGIGVNVHYIPIPWHPHYQALGYNKGEWPVAEGVYQRMISLPIFPAMTDRDVEDVITAVKKVVGDFRK